MLKAFNDIENPFLISLCISKSIRKFVTAPPVVDPTSIRHSMLISFSKQLRHAASSIFASSSHPSITDRILPSFHTSRVSISLYAMRSARVLYTTAVLAQHSIT